MDDSSFDKIIKDKLDHYEDSSFDPAALAGFHDKLASLQPVPWYEQRISHYMVAASLTLFTIVNAYLFWPRSEPIQKTVSENIYGQHAIDSLSNIIEDLQSENQVTLQERDSSFSVAKHFQSEASKNLAKANATPPQKLTAKVSLGLANSLPPNLYKVLMDQGLLIVEKDEVFLAPSESVDQHYKMLYLASQNESKKSLLPQLVLPELEMKSISVKGTYAAAPRQTKQREISAKMRSELEKHYFTGLGIALAPHLDYAKGVFSQGVGGLTPRVGIMADWIMSPRLSIESGIDFSTTKINLDKDFQTIRLPLADSSLGEVESIKIRNSLISTPLVIKYRQWVSEKTQAFVKIGYTPYFSIQQEYTWAHDFNKSPYPNPYPYPKPNPDPDHDRHQVTSVKETHNKGFYGATGIASIGLTRLVKNKHKIEASLFYEKSLASVGQEKLDMQLFGLRSAYWFKLR